MAKIYKRTDGAARINREAAAEQRAHGRNEYADRLEARADELESGKVRDATDDVLALVRFGLGRR